MQDGKQEVHSYLTNGFIIIWSFLWVNIKARKAPIITTVEHD